MGDSPDHSLQDRYAAVERLYSRGQWPQVLDACAALLPELPAQPGHPLRTRLMLLQGHTQLHGFGQVDAAATLYQQVLDSQPEALLQSIAEQELERCRRQHSAPQQELAAASLQPAPAPGLSAPFPFTPQAVGNPDIGQQACAMPWLEALGGIDPTTSTVPATPPEANPPWLAATASEPEPRTERPEADVIDEPDQIEVHQADPKRSDILDLIALASDEEPATGSLVTHEAPATDGPGHSATAEPPPNHRWSPAEQAELARGLLTVVLR